MGSTSDVMDQDVAKKPSSSFYKELFETGIFSDITLKFGNGNEFKAHSVVLAPKSTWFAKQMERSNEDKEIDCGNDDDINAFKSMIRFCYTKEYDYTSPLEVQPSKRIRLRSNYLVLVHQLGIKYDITGMATYCTSKFKSVLRYARNNIDKSDVKAEIYRAIDYIHTMPEVYGIDLLKIAATTEFERLLSAVLCQGLEQPMQKANPIKNEPSSTPGLEAENPTLKQQLRRAFRSTSKQSREETKAIMSKMPKASTEFFISVMEEKILQPPNEWLCCGCGTVFSYEGKSPSNPSLQLRLCPCCDVKVGAEISSLPLRKVFHIIGLPQAIGNGSTVTLWQCRGCYRVWDCGAQTTNSRTLSECQGCVHGLDFCRAMTVVDWRCKSCSALWRAYALDKPSMELKACVCCPPILKVKA